MPTSLDKKNSRFVQGGKTDIFEKRLGWWERYPNVAKKTDSDLIIEKLPAKYDGRPDLLSYDAYGDNNLEWVILQANNIVDINEEFVTGATIRVPHPRTLKSSVLTRMVDTNQ
jgi:Base plate wedge protein 53.